MADAERDEDAAGEAGLNRAAGATIQLARRERLPALHAGVGDAGRDTDAPRHGGPRHGGARAVGPAQVRMMAPAGGTSATGDRLRRRLLLAGAGIGVTAAVAALTPGHAPVARLSLGTAYAGLLLLGAALAIGPLNVLRGARNPPSSALRRDVGIFAGVFALLHVAVGLQVHFGGDMLAYFLHRDAAGGLHPRLDGFRLANFAGLAATLLFVMLLALSNNAALRWLKVKRWKALQRWSYAAAALVLAHGAIYQLLERRGAAFVALFLAVAAAVAAVQAAGFLRRGRDAAREGAP